MNSSNCKSLIEHAECCSITIIIIIISIAEYAWHIDYQNHRPLARNEQIFKNAVMRFFLQLYQQKCSYTFFFTPPPITVKKKHDSKATTTRQKIRLY